MKTYTIIGLLVVSCWASLTVASAQTPPPVPAQYSDIETLLETQIAAFSSAVHAGWDGTRAPVAHSSQLQSATSDMGSALLDSYYYPGTVLGELGALQALGVNAVTVHINFPILYSPYFSNQADYQSYLNFYTTLANEIHARGLKLIVESTVSVAYPGTSGLSFSSYYRSLPWSAYQAGRAQQAATIAQALRPDYLVVITEPDTEQYTSGQSNAGTVSGSTQLLQSVLQAAQGAGVPIGAGCGTWHPSFSQFIQSFSTQNVQFVDMHVYPVNKNYLMNALSAADTIHAAGKQVSISEAWTYKVRDSELLKLSYTQLFSRDPFSFWQTSDTAFLQAISDYANYKHLAFVSPFWSHYLYSYLDYNQYGSLSASQVIIQSEVSASNAVASGAFTATGRSFENLALPAPDRTAPSIPALALKSQTQTIANLTWNSASDNVGVAGYHLYRNGALVIATNQLSYSDLSLQPATKYTYTLSAFDASGNESALSAPLTVTTSSPPDNTAPSVPTGLTARATSAEQIVLNWLPSTDNVAVTGYRVYRGTTASNLYLFATTPTPTFLDTVAPNSTLYYAVSAYDASYNFSAQTQTISVTTPQDSTPPSIPSGISVVAVSATQVNLTWQASTDDYRVASYKILRGTSPTQLAQVAGTGSLSYSDTRVNAGTQYYYSIVAVDVAKNSSAPSAAISVKTQQ